MGGLYPLQSRVPLGLDGFDRSKEPPNELLRQCLRPTQKPPQTLPQRVPAQNSEHF
jgi:hypothetical protein